MIVHTHPRSPQLIVLDQGESDYYTREGGSPECALIEWAKQFVKEDKAFVDIGAHAGSWSLSLAPHAKRVVSFEAQRRTYYQLCGGIVLNDLCDKVTAHHLALGDLEADQIELHIISRDGGGSSVIRNPTFEKHPLRSEKTRMTTLDTFMLDDVELIKIDVEGAERQVLIGARETLERCGWPTILFESWFPEWRGEWAKPLREELFAFINGLGYRIVPINSWPEMFLAER